MIPRITVRRFVESDIEKLATALAPDMSTARIQRRWHEVRDGYREILVAELDGEVVGTVSTTHLRLQLPDSLRMFALDVGPAFRRQGVGRSLIEAIEDKARTVGLGKVNLEVALDNTEALRLYERMGYRRFGAPIVNRWEQLNYDGSSEEVEEHSWIMVKDLDPLPTP